MKANARERVIQWATLTLTQGEVLDAFALYCRDELDDVTVLEESPTRLELAWKRERVTVELRADLPAEGSTLVIGPLDESTVRRLVDDATLRTRVAVYDLDRLEKVNTVRSSVFVYFEWFLRDVYGVKVLPANAFTQGLVAQGIISLGMG